MMKKYALLIITILLFPSIGFADTHASDSCSAAHIQTAIDAASDGDLVTVPAGECTISTQINVTNKRITIQGNGIDSTILTANITTGTRPAIFKVTGKPSIIKGFTFTGTAPTYGGHIVFENLAACAGESCTNDELFRVTGNKFLTGGYAVLTTWTTDGFGLIDNNIFTFTADTTAMQFYGGSRTGWGNATTLGTNKAVVVENNTFTNNSAGKTRGLFDADGGARVVSRYNTIVDGPLAGWHGYCGVAAGTMQAEIYNNAASHSGTFAFGMFLRGGTGVIYNNTLTGTANYDIALGEYRLDAIGSCSGDAASCCTSYPCLDQIGRGTDQALDPMYLWNNTINGSAATVTVYDINEGTCDPVPDVDDFIKVNRDYYLSEKSGYVPLDCPHPLAVAQDSLTGACTTTAGTGGYNVATSHTVTVSTSTGCTVSHSGANTVGDGETLAVTMTAAYGYTISGSGCSGSLSGSTFTTGAISADCTVTCTGLGKRGVLGGTGTVSLGGSGVATLGN